MTVFALFLILRERIPIVLFLKYDPKDVIITLGGLIWGPLTSCIVSVIVSSIEMMTVSETGILGCIMNIISTCSFACTAAFIYKKRHTLSGALLGLILGSAAMVAIMLLWNYLITPLYMGYPREAVVKLLLPAFLPFNLLKAGLNASITFYLYKPVVIALRKSGFVESQNASKERRSVGLYLSFTLIISTCILSVLSMNGLIWGGVDERKNYIFTGQGCSWQRYWKTRGKSYRKFRSIYERSDTSAGGTFHQFYGKKKHIMPLLT